MYEGEAIVLWKEKDENKKSVRKKEIENLWDRPFRNQVWQKWSLQSSNISWYSTASSSDIWWPKKERFLFSLLGLCPSAYHIARNWAAWPIVFHSFRMKGIRILSSWNTIGLRSYDVVGGNGSMTWSRYKCSDRHASLCTKNTYSHGVRVVVHNVHITLIWLWAGKWTTVCLQTLHWLFRAILNTAVLSRDLLRSRFHWQSSRIGSLLNYTLPCHCSIHDY